MVNRVIYSMAGTVRLPETKLTVIKEILGTKEAVKSGVNYLFKYFAKYCKGRDWTIVLNQLGVTFFEYRSYFSSFSAVGENPFFHEDVVVLREYRGNNSVRLLDYFNRYVARFSIFEFHDNVGDFFTVTVKKYHRVLVSRHHVLEE